MQVVLADDHTLVRAGFRRLLEAFDGVEVVAEADNGLQVLDLVALHRPDVLILDVSMPGKNGLEVTGEVKEAYPEVGILICSMHATLQYVKHALSVGASGFMVKDCAPAELQMALTAVASGQTYVSQRLSGQMVDAMMRPAKAESGGEAALTPGLVDDDGRRVREVDRAHVGDHRDVEAFADPRESQDLVRQAHRLGTEEKGIALPVLHVGVGAVTADGEDKDPAPLV